MDVAVLGVPEDHRVGVGVAVEQSGQLHARACQVRDRHDHVLQQRGRAARTSARHRGVEPLAQLPQPCPQGGVVGEPHRPAHRQLVQGRTRLAHQPLQLYGCSGLVLQQQRRLAGHVQGLDHGGRVGEPLADPQRGGVHQLQRGGAGGHQPGQGVVRRVQVVEHHQRGRDVTAHRDGGEGGGGDEGQCPLAADQQVGEDLGRGGVVDQCVDAIAHGVLHRELLGDLGHRGRVRDHAFAQCQQAGVELGLQCPEPLVGVRGAGVDHGARGQHRDQRLQRPVAVLHRSAGHAGGVVGHHPADRAGGLAGRVGAQLAAVPGQAGVHLLDGDTGLDAHPRAVVQDLDTLEVPPDVGQHLVGAALAGEAGAAGAEGEPDAGRRGRPQQASDLLGVPRGYHRRRQQQEVGGVVGERPAVQFAQAQLVRLRHAPPQQRGEVRGRLQRLRARHVDLPHQDQAIPRIPGDRRGWTPEAIPGGRSRRGWGRRPSRRCAR